jgi:hypothetical protein
MTVALYCINNPMNPTIVIIFVAAASIVVTFVLLVHKFLKNAK